MSRCHLTPMFMSLNLLVFILPQYAVSFSISSTNRYSESINLTVTNQLDHIAVRDHTRNTDALAIEFLEYLVLGVVVLLLLVILFVLRYMLAMKEKCPNFCCAWFPSPERSLKKRAASTGGHRPKGDHVQNRCYANTERCNEQSQFN